MNVIDFAVAQNPCRICKHPRSDHLDYPFSGCRECSCWLFRPKLNILDGGYDTKSQEEPVCPYCGECMSDAWELNLSDEECTTVECGHCLKEYVVTASLQVSYDTHKPEFQ